MKSRDLETLTANMHTAYTWAAIDEDIAKQPKIKLPDRRALMLWNSFDLSHFRASEENWEDWELQKDEITKRNLEARQVARDTGTNMTDLGFVAEAMQQQQRQQQAMDQHNRDMLELDRRQREGMHQEHMQGMEQLARSQREAQQRQEMHEEVLRAHVDMAAADRDRLIAAKQAAGVVYNNVTDNSTHNTDNSTHNTLHEQGLHNEAMTLLHTHSQQFGAYMLQHSMNQEAMMQELMLHLRHNRPRDEIPITMLNTGAPPPPPPGAGAIRLRSRRENNIPYYKPQVAATGSKPPPPPPPAPPPASIAPLVVAEAPMQIQAPEPKRGRGRPRKPESERGRSRSAKARKKSPTHGADPELKEALVEAGKKAKSPERFRIATPSETPQVRRRGRPKKAKEEEEEDVIPQVVVAPKRRGRSSSKEVVPVPKAKATRRKKSVEPETPYVGPQKALAKAAEDLGEDVIPQFQAKPVTPARRGRPPKNLGLEDAKKTPGKRIVKAKAPEQVIKTPGKSRNRKVVVVEPEKT